jgi:hypothetical protein
MKFKTGFAWTVLAIWLLADVARAAFVVPARPPNYRRSTFSQAPRAVQDYLLKSMAACGVAANIVRSDANFEVEPIGGVGHNDYYFNTAVQYWSGPQGPYNVKDPCTEQFQRSILSMDLGGGRYKTFNIEYEIFYFKNARWLLFLEDRKFGCPGRAGYGLHAYGRLTVWDRTTAAFRPVTGCITLERAFGWAIDHGYRPDDHGL